jgi:hypothetical protein
MPFHAHALCNRRDNPGASFDRHYDSFHFFVSRNFWGFLFYSRFGWHGLEWHRIGVRLICPGVCPGGCVSAAPGGA